MADGAAGTAQSTGSTIRNQGFQRPRTHQVANRLRHGARNIGALQGKETEIGRKIVGDCASKGIVMNLQKAQLGKVTETARTARQLVVVDIQMHQVAQTKELAGQAARQLVKVNVEKVQVGQHADLAGNLARQASALEA